MYRGKWTFTIWNVCWKVIAKPITGRGRAQNCFIHCMLQLRVQIETNVADWVEELLFTCGAVSVSYTDGASNPILEPRPGDHPLWPHLYVYGLFADENASSLAAKALQNNPQVGTQIVLQQIDEYGWQEKFQQQFNAVQYSPRLCVYPSWKENPNPDGISLQLDPGLAFGTGQHPTTFLCMQWLAQTCLNEKSLIDFGCGSGILALAACKLGAQHVYAVDIDPQAILATEENRKKNSIAASQISVGDTAVLEDISVDIIIANILAAPLLALRDTFLRHMNLSSTLVVSGILSTQSQNIIDAYSQHFKMIKQSVREDWACLVFDRLH